MSTTNMNKFAIQPNTNSSTSNHNTTANNIDKRKSHNCPDCDRSFTRPYRLNDHISFSHTDEVCIFFIILDA
jgi:transposase-like protein